MWEIYTLEKAWEVGNELAVNVCIRILQDGPVRAYVRVTTDTGYDQTQDFGELDVVKNSTQCRQYTGIPITYDARVKGYVSVTASINGTSRTENISVSPPPPPPPPPPPADIIIDSYELYPTGEPIEQCSFPYHPEDVRKCWRLTITFKNNGGSPSYFKCWIWAENAPSYIPRDTVYHLSPYALNPGETYRASWIVHELKGSEYYLAEVETVSTGNRRYYEIRVTTPIAKITSYSFPTSAVKNKDENFSLSVSNVGADGKIFALILNSSNNPGNIVITVGSSEITLKPGEAFKSTTSERSMTIEGKVKFTSSGKYRIILGAGYGDAIHDYREIDG